MRSVRWHPLNAFCLSNARHRYFTEHPAAFIQFVISKIGQERFNELCKLAQAPRKFTPREKEGLYHHYLTEYARLCQGRQNGRSGRIEFFFPNPIPEADPRGTKANAQRKAKAKRAKIKARKLTNPKLKKKLNGQVVERTA